VRGNVNNIADIEEPVLGYFMVAGVSEKRIYTDRPKLLFSIISVSLILNLCRGFGSYPKVIGQYISRKLNMD